MSVFFDNSITDIGKMLWAEMQAGGSFLPTRITIGSGYLTGKTTRTVTEVLEPVKDIFLNKKTKLTEGDFVFGGNFSNRDILNPFYYRELGLYAKVSSGITVSKQDYDKKMEQIDASMDRIIAMINEEVGAVLLADIDCGSWEETPVTLHNTSAMAHVNLNADGNANGVVSTADELAAHETDPNAHPNIILDGNNN